MSDSIARMITVKRCIVGDPHDADDGGDIYGGEFGGASDHRGGLDCIRLAAVAAIDRRVSCDL